MYNFFRVKYGLESGVWVDEYDTAIQHTKILTQICAFIDHIKKNMFARVGNGNVVSTIIRGKNIEFEIPKELKSLSKWITVIIDDSIHDSPRLEKDGTITLWEEDLSSPLFFRMLIEKFKDFIC